MAYYSDIVTDEQTKNPVAKVSVTVLTKDDTVAALTDDAGLPLLQPLVTQPTGFFAFNAADATYTLIYRYGGRVVRADEVIVGLPPEISTIGNKAVTNTKLADMPGATLKGALSTGTPTDLSTSQVAALVQPAIDAIPRARSYAGPFSLTSLGTDVPAPGSYFSAGGNALSFTNLISTPTGRSDSDNQRTMALFTSTTVDDGNSQEQTVNIQTKIQTGYSRNWATSTAFALGDNIRNKTANTVYRCVQAGTSASTGTGPSTVAKGIVDGSVRWDWINDSAIDAKNGAYIETLVLPGAGNSWGMAVNTQIAAGVLTDFAVNTEFDLDNNCGTDSIFGGLNKYNLLITTVGANRSTACVEINTRNTVNATAIWGLHFSGIVGSNSIIGIDSNGAIGIGLGMVAGGATNPVFTDSVIKDGSTAPVGINLLGTYSSAAFRVSGTTPAAFSASATTTLGSFYCNSTSVNGMFLAGTYSNAQIQGTNFKVKPNGGLLVNTRNYASDSAAAAGGVEIGEFYNNAGVVRVRLS